VNEWIQPPEPYYHFESENLGEPNTGKYYNGICVYNHDASEYMAVRMLEPLEAGREYCMSLYIRLARFKSIRFTLSEGIGAYFTPDKPSIGNKTYLFDAPQVNLKYALLDDRFGWTKLSCNFVAEGGERYLVLGHFFNQEELESVDPLTMEYRTDLIALQKEKDIEMTEAYATIDQKYPKVHVDYSNPLKEYSKKELKQFQKEKESLHKRRTEKQQAAAEISTTFDQKLGALEAEYTKNGNFQSSPYFSLRYYFDDVEVRALYGDDFCDCGAPTVLEKGSKFDLRNILFATGKWELLEGSYDELNRLADFLKEHPEISISLNGHTDNVGSAADNQLLSENRAKAVNNYLIAQGATATNISWKGFGATQSVANNSTEKGRQQNRRVEVEITAAGE